MSRALADTSIFIANENGRPLARAAFPDEIAVSIITIGELRSGVLAAADVTTRDRRLSTLLTALDLQPLPVDERTAAAWARLRIALRRHSAAHAGQRLLDRGDRARTRCSRDDAGR